jgi:acetolactate synthase regulatory subunit
VEIHLRLSVPDRPGMLAAVTGAISHAGGDIAAVGVVETADDCALDDIEVVIDPGRLPDLLAAINGVEGVALVHAGPSRGLPGDAVARLALCVESLLNGAMALEHAVTTLIGGLLGAARAELLPASSARPSGDRVMALDFDHQVLVIERDYRFTDTEQERAAAILRTLLEAARARQP